MPELMSDHTTPSNQSHRTDDGPESDRRAFPRHPVPDVFVAVESESKPGHPDWAGSAIDISGGGLALMLPEEISVGSELYLTFRLEDGTAFVRVPSTVVRKDYGYCMGAVRFDHWGDGLRLALLSSLARN